MRKLISKIFPACVIVIVILLILLGLRLVDGDGTVPSYRFLAGRNPIKCEKAKTENEDRRYIYSFEADFNDLCSKANAELIPDGFVIKTFVVENLAGNKFPCRSYRLKGRFLRGSVFIYIYNNRQYTELPNPQKDALYMKDGWVTIEAGRGWRWPF